MDSTTTLLKKITLAARCGWGPAELLHVLGPKAHAILYRAAPLIPAEVSSPALRQQWLKLAPPTDPFYDVELLSTFDQILSGLPVLRDSPVLDLPVDPHSREGKIRRRIESLLRKAESTSFSEEADALISKAQQMRQDYRLNHTESENLTVVSRRVLISGPYIKHKASLLGVICEANGVSCLLLHESGIAVIFGQPEDLDHVEDLFSSLLRQCLYYMDHAEGATIARRNRQTASYRRSFQLSYASRIGELLSQANKSTDSPPTATTNPRFPNTAATASDNNLPILARRARLAERTRDKLFPFLSTMSLSSSNSHGELDGFNAANSSHFSGDSAGVSSQSRALSA